MTGYRHLYLFLVLTLAAAGLLGVPIVLQEQNSIPGWTNRFLAPFADLICCGFEDAVSAFPSLPAEWTGNPVRADFFDVPDIMPHKPPRLLILGGSHARAGPRFPVVARHN